jgi:lysozyme
VVYPDSAGHDTIGYGHKLTDAEKKGGVFKGGITEKEALALFRQDSAKVDAAISRLVTVPISQGQRDALASLIFNVGEGAFSGYNLLTELNAGNYRKALSEFSDINKVTDPKTGVKIFNKGLNRRRIADMKLFKSGVYDNNK